MLQGILFLLGFYFMCGVALYLMVQAAGGPKS